MLRAELIGLLHLASPALPIGAYSYSQGLEAAVHAGLLTDAAGMLAWIAGGLEILARGELPVFAGQCRRWSGFHQDARAATLLAQDNEEFLASRESAELRRETEQMGWSLAQLCVALEWGDAARRQCLQAMQPLALPTAFAFAAMAQDAALDHAVTAYAFAWAENQVAAALKAMALGQLAGQRALVALREPLSRAVDIALATPADRISTFAPQLGVLCARHESQYSRLFRS